MSAFEEIGVLPELIRAVDELGWTLPSAIQAEAIPLLLGGGDVLAAAETGSGKTAAFALPMLQLVHEALRRGQGSAPAPAPSSILTSSSSSSSSSSSEAAASVVSPSSSSVSADCVDNDEHLSAPVVLNSSDREPMLSVSPDGLSCQSRAENAWQGVRATVGVHGGKVCFEVAIEDDGLCRIGWSTQAAALEIGVDAHSFGFGGSGKKSHAKKFDSYGKPFGRGDSLCCALDWETRQISYSLNGVSLGTAFQLPEHIKNGSSALYPSVTMKCSQLSFNFGSAPFQFPPPVGFVPLNSIPLAHSTMKSAKSMLHSARKGPLGVIIEPTRELAEQVFDEINKFKKYLQHPSIRHCLCVGGDDMRGMKKALSDGVHIIIGTPGRLQSLVKDGTLRLSDCQLFILDEADRLLDSSNTEMIMDIIKRLPVAGSQIGLFSATLHSVEIKEMAGRITRHATWIDLKGKDAVPDTVDHAVVFVNPMIDQSWTQRENNRLLQTDSVHTRDSMTPGSREALSEATKLLKPKIAVQLIDAFKMDQCLIFCRTKVDCDNLEAYFTALGGGNQFRGKAEKGKENVYSCAVLHADRAPADRKRNFHAFKEGDIRFLICTDVAARGLDISGLPFTINMTLPSLSEDYIHRIGRVGRADCIGLAISIVSTVEEKIWFHTCPSKGKGCTNTHLVDERGCCIWQNEQQLLKAIETRLGQVTVATLDPTDLLLGRENMASKYGLHKDEAAGEASKLHLELLRPAWHRLAKLEVESQNLFFMYQNSQTAAHL